MSLQQNQNNQAWYALTFCEQMGNIGSEISRAINWQRKNNRDQMEKALVRGFDLFDMTLNDDRYKKYGGKLKEAARAREVVADYFYGGNFYRSDANFLNKYFYYFGVAARKK